MSLTDVVAKVPEPPPERLFNAEKLRERTGRAPSRQAQHLLVVVAVELNDSVGHSGARVVLRGGGHPASATPSLCLCLCLCLRVSATSLCLCLCLRVSVSASREQQQQRQQVSGVSQVSRSWLSLRVMGIQSRIPTPDHRRCDVYLR